MGILERRQELLATVGIRPGQVAPPFIETSRQLDVIALGLPQRESGLQGREFAQGTTGRDDVEFVARL
jgi:hypothetical protein